jgi:hypothetical protein
MYVQKFVTLVLPPVPSAASRVDRLGEELLRVPHIHYESAKDVKDTHRLPQTQILKVSKSHCRVTACVDSPYSGRRIHCSVEVTELSTNQLHSLPGRRLVRILPARQTDLAGGLRTHNSAPLRRVSLRGPAAHPVQKYLTSLCFLCRISRRRPPPHPRPPHHPHHRQRLRPRYALPPPPWNSLLQWTRRGNEF